MKTSHMIRYVWLSVALCLLNTLDSTIGPPIPRKRSAPDDSDAGESHGESDNGSRRGAKQARSHHTWDEYQEATNWLIANPDVFSDTPERRSENRSSPLRSVGADHTRPVADHWRSSGMSPSHSASVNLEFSNSNAADDEDSVEVFSEEDLQSLLNKNEDDSEVFFDEELLFSLDKNEDDSEGEHGKALAQSQSAQTTDDSIASGSEMGPSVQSAVNLLPSSEPLERTAANSSAPSLRHRQHSSTFAFRDTPALNNSNFGESGRPTQGIARDIDNQSLASTSGHQSVTSSFPSELLRPTPSQSGQLPLETSQPSTSSSSQPPTAHTGRITFPIMKYSSNETTTFRHPTSGLGKLEKLLRRKYHIYTKVMKIADVEETIARIEWDEFIKHFFSSSSQLDMTKSSSYLAVEVLYGMLNRVEMMSPDSLEKWKTTGERPPVFLGPEFPVPDEVEVPKPFWFTAEFSNASVQMLKGQETQKLPHHHDKQTLEAFFLVRRQFWVYAHPPSNVTDFFQVGFEKIGKVLALGREKTNLYNSGIVYLAARNAAEHCVEAVNHFFGQEIHSLPGTSALNGQPQEEETKAKLRQLLYPQLVQPIFLVSDSQKTKELVQQFQQQQARKTF